MTDNNDCQQDGWTYIHPVVENEDIDTAVHRFRVQIENASEGLDLPFEIEAQIRIIDRQDDEYP
jgi:hypothetical protein